MKRRRSELAVPVPETPADSASGSELDADEQETDPPLDSFEKELAQPIEALNEAVTDATAFLQPSEQLSTLARAAARVSCTVLRSTVFHPLNFAFRMLLLYAQSC